MKLPEPQTRTFSSLVAEIEKGQIKIRQFQRDFVWPIQKSAGLIDSILKGYPIGTFIFWRTKDRLRTVRNIGGYILPEPGTEEYVDFVLDGQQRLTSLYACIKGITVTRGDGNTKDDFSKIYIDLTANEDESIVVTDSERADDGEESHISILDLLTGDFDRLAAFPKKYHDKLKKYKNRIESYQYSIIQVADAPIDIATEIFTRVNVGGKPLSVFEIMVAKTFDHKSNFDLSEKYQGLIERLSPHNYETISDATVLQTVAMIIKGECKRQQILKLDKRAFINAWDSAEDAIERAVEYFISFYRIPVSQLLPYNALVVPFAYFFSKHKDTPTGDKQNYLQDFFWRCSLSGRYSSSVESKLAQDIKRIDNILQAKLPHYDWPIDTSAEFIYRNGWFSAGRSYIKAILCLYAYMQPKSFNNNSLVNVRNYWLKQANSRNYHHFFPRAYLQKQKVDEFFINHILNITIVDDFLNKREIGAKPPAQYMKKFKKVNFADLESTMKSHFIGDLDKFGIWTNDYDSFLAGRAKLLRREIAKRIIKQDVDKNPQPDVQSEYEEDSTVM